MYDRLIAIEKARQGRDKDLGILVHDTDLVVRMTVSEYGRPDDLDVLVNDERADVRRVAVQNMSQQ
jgi:hypothetical protein